MMLTKKFSTPAEQSFMKVLETTLTDEHRLFSQVAINRLVYMPGTDKTNPGRKTWFNKISRRSVDFVICDRTTIQPLIAIELDDATHNKPARIKRDQEVNAVFEAIGLRLVHIEAQRSYNTRELAEMMPELKSAT